MRARAPFREGRAIRSVQQLGREKSSVCFSRRAASTSSIEAEEFFLDDIFTSVASALSQHGIIIVIIVTEGVARS